MDKLRQYIKDHESDFEYLAPPEGHRERFVAKLDRRRQRRSLPEATRGMWAAAIAALLLVGVAVLVRPVLKSDIDNDDTFANVDIRYEMQEAERYYSMCIDDIAAQVSAIASQNTDVPQIADIARDCDKVVEDCREFRNSVYPSLETTEASLYAISCHYSSSIDALNMMMERMKDIKDDEL